MSESTLSIMRIEDGGVRMGNTATATTTSMMHSKRQKRSSTSSRRKRNQSPLLAQAISVLGLSLLLLLTSSFAVVVQAVILTEGNDDGTGANTCRILGFFPTHAHDDKAQNNKDLLFPRWTTPEFQRVSINNLAVAHMAVDHFNTRDPSVVPELASLVPEECQVQLDLDWISDDVNSKEGGALVLEKQTEICAMTGNYDPTVAKALLPISESLEVPQLVYYTLDATLSSSRGATSSAIALPPSVLPRVRSLAEYLNAAPDIMPQRKYMSLIYEEEYTSSYIAQCFQEDAADKFDLISDKYQDDHLGVLRSIDPKDLQTKVIRTIKESGIKTIFLNKLDSHGLALTAELLHAQNMLTDEYLFIFTPQAVPTDAVGDIFGTLEVDSPMDRLLRGGMVLDHVDPYRVDAAEDPFLQAWQARDHVTELSQLYPELAQNVSREIGAVPADYGSFLYDAIITAGLGACYSTTLKMPNNTQNFRDDIQSMPFTGASGDLVYCRPGVSPNRCNDGQRFGIFNIQAVPVEEDEDGIVRKHTYKTQLTAVWSEEERWQSVAPYIYRDGTTKAPTLLREAMEKNYLSTGVRAFGYFLYGSSAAFALGSLVAIAVLRKDPVITRSQPFFLAILCVGSLIMSTSILTLSFDESVDISSSGLNISCMASLWFFFVGHVLSFSTLVSKMWRLDQVLQFRRNRSVSRLQALLPLIMLVMVTILVLVVWTAVDPYTWEREWVTLVPAETYGSCQSEYFWAFFGTLLAIVVFAEGLTLWFAHKTSDVNSDFNDTEMSRFAIFTQFQAWIVGVPILAVLGNSSAEGVYMSRALLIWIFSISGVACVVGRRVFRAIQIRYNPEEDDTRSPSVYISGIEAGSSHRSMPKGSLRGSSHALGASTKGSSSKRFGGRPSFRRGGSSSTTSNSGCLVDHSLHSATPRNSNVVLEDSTRHTSEDISEPRSDNDSPEPRQLGTVPEPSALEETPSEGPSSSIMSYQDEHDGGENDDADASENDAEEFA